VQCFYIAYVIQDIMYFTILHMPFNDKLGILYKCETFEQSIFINFPPYYCTGIKGVRVASLNSMLCQISQDMSN
jgi:hypothetical protein